MPEYIIFQDRGSNSLSHERVNYITTLLFKIRIQKIPFEKMDFLDKPTILTAIQSPKFPFVYNIAIDVACAWKITAHLCWRWQRQHAPRRLADQLDGRAAAQHTAVVA